MQKEDLMVMVFVEGKGCRQYIFRDRSSLEKWCNRAPWRNRFCTCMIVFCAGDLLGDVRARVSMPSLPGMAEELFWGMVDTW